MYLLRNGLKFTIGSLTGLCFHRFIASLGMKIFTFFIATALVEFGQSKLLELNADLGMFFSTFFAKSALVGCIEVAHICRIKLNYFNWGHPLKHCFKPLDTL